MSAWTSPAEQMPDGDITVLIAFGDGEVWTGFHDGDDGWRFVSGDPVRDPVCGWMEFPEYRSAAPDREMPRIGCVGHDCADCETREQDKRDAARYRFLRDPETDAQVTVVGYNAFHDSLDQIIDRVAAERNRIGRPSVDQVMRDDLRACLRDLIATIDLHTDCMNNSIAREALDPYIERAEDLLGETLAEIIA